MRGRSRCRRDAPRARATLYARSIGSAGAICGATSSATNPIRRCVASQNGFVAECPQRQSTTASPARELECSPPSASTIRHRPDDLVRAVRPHGDREVVHDESLPSPLQSRPVPLRICLVTPHAWSVPHDTNEHVAGVADALRARGHAVVVLAPSSRSGRPPRGAARAPDGRARGVVAISRAVPVSPRAAVGMPVGVRANVATALRRGDFDVVHGFDPAMPGLSYVALLEARTTTAATFVDPERLGFPPRRNQRDRLLARIDTAARDVRRRRRRAPRRGFPARTPSSRPASTSSGSRPRRDEGEPRRDRDVGRRAARRPRRAPRAPRAATAGRRSSLRTAPLAARPSIPHRPARPRPRPHRGARRGARRRSSATRRSSSPRRRASRACATRLPRPDARVVEPPGVDEQPELAAAALLRFAEDAEARRARCGRAARRARERRASRPSPSGSSALYPEAQGARRARTRATTTEPLADREWIVADLHMHTRWSHDCSIEPARARRPRRVRGARRDRGHGPQRLRRRPGDGRARASARPDRDPGRGGEDRPRRRGDRPLPPRGDPARDVVRRHRGRDPRAGGRRLRPAPVRPHALDSRRPRPCTGTSPRSTSSRSTTHGSSSTPTTTRRSGSRGSTGSSQGAGSDAHVLQGVGTGALRMRRFDGPEEFLLSLRTATVLRRPKSLALPPVAQVGRAGKERVGSG